MLSGVRTTMKSTCIAAFAALLHCWCNAQMLVRPPMTSSGSNGFMVDYLAPKWGALLVFPEERYYGKSLPFGQDSWTTDHVKSVLPNEMALLSARLDIVGLLLLLLASPRARTLSMH